MLILFHYLISLSTFYFLILGVFPLSFWSFLFSGTQVMTCICPYGFTLRP